MSADDPTDDELEREATRDAAQPLGNARHSPKLETRSRAINPRQQLQAEADGQSYDSRQGLQGRQGIISQRDALSLLTARDDGYEARRLPRTMAGRLELVRHLTEGPEDSATEPSDCQLAEAWDRYVAAALSVASQLGVKDVEGTAVQVADRLLEERRKRFG